MAQNDKINPVTLDIVKDSLIAVSNEIFYAFAQTSMRDVYKRQVFILSAVHAEAPPQTVHGSVCQRILLVFPENFPKFRFVSHPVKCFRHQFHIDSRKFPLFIQINVGFVPVTSYNDLLHFFLFRFRYWYFTDTSCHQQKTCEHHECCDSPAPFSFAFVSHSATPILSVASAKSVPFGLFFGSFSSFVFPIFRFLYYYLRSFL